MLEMRMLTMTRVKKLSLGFIFLWEFSSFDLLPGQARGPQINQRETPSHFLYLFIYKKFIPNASVMCEAREGLTFA